ncbi:MAG TPA: cation:proton antiporter [Cyclobacteriaceae bacterium]|jgi:CPA2 family monovalent cation:H+ antiporter-2
MGHLPALIQDLALILIAGAIVTLLFRKIRQPLVLGYIIAGFLVGPHFQYLPSVTDNDNIETLAEIGVIFLLFSLGLEFSFKKLMRVGGAASVTALVEIIAITALGYYAGRLMGWSTMDSLFLGGMLASSSTTIIIRAFDELGVKTRQYARIVFGVLVVEDIVVILLMVLLSTIAVAQEFEGMEIVYTVIKLVFFLAFWFLSGIFLLPSLLRGARALFDGETLLIFAIGLCLGMVVLATHAGFSAELGAFIMGSIIAETTKAETVEHLIKPVKDLFGAVFFVSVGMMIDPQAIVEYGVPVMVVTLITLFGKLIATTIGAILSGQPLKQAVQVGMSMAQIGEFAFIVATLGLSLGVISNFLFPVAVGASAITTFTTPYLIKYSEPFYNFLERMLPEKWIKALNTYSTGTANIQAESTWKVVLKSYATIAATNGILVLAIMVFSLNFLMPFLRHNIDNPTLRNFVGLIVTLGVAAPFLWAFMAKRPNNLAYRELWMEKRYNRGPLLVIEIARVVVGVLIIGFFVFRVFSTQMAIMVVVPVAVLILFILARRIQNFYQRIELRFLTNLNAREAQAERAQREERPERDRFKTELQPWDAHIIELEVAPEAEYVGKTLMELQWRERYGINIVFIRRGEKLIHAPGRYNKLLPHDLVGIIATDEQIQKFKPVFDAKDESIPAAEVNIEDIALQKIVVNEYTKLKGKDIRSSGLRERTNGLVIGIERGGQRILNPESTTVFEWDDIVWIVGDRKKINELARPGGKAEEKAVAGDGKNGKKSEVIDNR